MLKYFSTFGLIPSKNDATHIYNSKIIIIISCIIMFLLPLPIEREGGYVYLNSIELTAGNMGARLGLSIGTIVFICFFSIPICLFYRFILKRSYSIFNNWIIPILSLIYLIGAGASIFSNIVGFPR